MHQTPFFENVKNRLNQQEQSDSPLYGWELIQSRKKSYQRLYEGRDYTTIRAHQDREVEETTYSLTVYCVLDDSDSIGLATTTLYPFNDIDTSIDQVLALALQSKNKKWNLLTKQADSYPQVITYDKAIKTDPLAIMGKIEQSVESELGKYQDISVNSAEAYVNYENILRETHTGIITYKEKSDVYFEIALEKRGQKNNKEVHEILKSVRYEDMDFTKFMGDCALQVNSLGNTQEPETNESPVILIDAYAISNILSALISQLNAAQEYHHLPFLNIDDPVYKTQKSSGSDTLTIELDPFIDGFTLSGGYTSEGIISEKAMVISNDKVCNRQINNRYGQYLGLAPNGITGNMRVTPGTVNEQALRSQAGSYYDIIKLSSLLINAQNLTWSSEIKLAKHYDQDGNVILIKGGVISGSIRDNLSDFSFSSEIDSINAPGSSYDAPIGYIGPKSMLIRKGVSIAGS